MAEEVWQDWQPQTVAVPVPAQQEVWQDWQPQQVPLSQIPLQAIKNLPSDLYQMGSDVVSTAQGIGHGKMPSVEGTARTVGGLAAGVAGAGTGATFGAGLGALGGPLAPVTVPLGGIIGGGLGFGAGLLGFNKLNQLTGSDTPTTPEEDVRGLVYNSTQGAALSGLGKATKYGAGKVAAPFEPLTKAGQQKIAANVVQEAVGGSEAALPIIDALSKVRNGTFSKFETPAEISQNPGLAALEKNVARSSLPGVEEFGTRAAERAALRDQTIRGLSTQTDVAPEVAGAELQKGLSELRKKAKTGENAAYNAIDPTNQTSISLEGIRGDILDAANQYYGSKGPAMGRELRALLNEATTRPKPKTVEPSGLLDASGRPIAPPAPPKLPLELPLEDLQNLRSRALAISQKAKGPLVQDSRAAALAGNIADNLKKAVEKAASDKKGMSEQQAKLWEVARQLTAKKGQTFDRGAVRKVIRQQQFGYGMPPEKVVSTLSAGPTAIEQLKSTGSPRLLEIARGQMTTKLSGMTPAQLSRYVKANRGTLSKLFSAQEMNKLSEVVRDIKNEQSVGELSSQASKGGSNTFQNLAIDKYIEDKISSGSRIGKLALQVGLPGGGAAVGGPMGAIAGALLSRPIEGFIGKAVGNVKSTIRNATLNPQAMRELLTPSIPKGTRTSLGVGNILLALRQVEQKQKQQREKSVDTPPPGMLARFSPPAIENLAVPPVTEQPKAETVTNSENLEPDLDAIRHVESRGKLNAVSTKGARGPYQLMPTNIKTFGVKNPHDDAESRVAARKLLSEELKRFGGDRRIAYAAYNAGSPKVKKAIRAAKRFGWEPTFDRIQYFLPQETRNYVQKVLEALKTNESKTRVTYGV